MALTFVLFYPPNAGIVRNAQIAVGSLGVAGFVFGLLFYVILRCWMLDYL
jgi:hypothetical protein